LGPTDILLDDFASGLFAEPGLMLTRTLGAALDKAPDIYDSADYTSATDVDLFSLEFSDVLFRHYISHLPITKSALMGKFVITARVADC
jgi:hypothetical protein